MTTTRTAATGRVSSPRDARLDQLERLARLRAAGVLDDAELRAEKARILGEDLLARTHT